MKKYILFIFLIAATPDLSSQAEGTIYNSDFEQSIFKQYSDSLDIDPLELFLAIDYKEKSQVVSSRLDRFISVLNSQLVNQNKMKKKLKIIYNSVHDEFFTKYTEQVFFSEIFTTGHYNCVTATALYAMVLDTLGIDYEIKETPTHIYLVADPAETKFMFESTLPTNGLIQFDARFQKDYIDYLHKNKIISDDEYDTRTISSLFQEHYSRDKSIDLIKLAGIQYYNDGVFAIEEKEYQKAQISLQKAHELYASNTINYVLNVAITNNLDKEYSSKKYNPQTLSLFFEINKNDETSVKNGISYFNDVTSELLINRSAYQKYKEFFDGMDISMLDSSSLRDIYDTYYTMVAYYHYTNDDYSKSLNCLKSAYDINPENLQTKQMIKEVGTKYIYRMLDEEYMLDSLEYYCNQLKILNQDKNLAEMRLYAITNKIEDLYQKADFNSIRLLIEKMNKFLRNNKDTGIQDTHIENAYARTASFYVQDRQYDKAEEVLRQALEFAPRSTMLKTRLESVREFNKGYKGSDYSEKALKEYNYAYNQAQKSKDAINKCFYKDAMKKWVTFKIIEGGEIYEPSPGEEFDFVLKLNRRADIIYYEEVMKGNWIYNENNCTLTFNIDGESERVSILISELSPTRMSGIIFFDGDHADSYRIFLKAD